MKRNIQYFALLLLLFLMLFSSGCALFNQGPVIESTPVLTGKVLIEYEYQVIAIDADEDPLTYSLLLKPEGMTINETTGLIEWIPQENQTGTHDVEVEVSDGKKSTLQVFTINVEEAILDSVSVDPASVEIEVGDTQEIGTVTAHYDNGTTALINASSLVFISNNTDVTQINNDGEISGIAEGETTISVAYTEGDITKIHSVEVTVFEAAILVAIQVEPENVIMYEGQTASIDTITAFYDNDSSATISPSSAIYASNNTSIATVSEAGVIYGKAAGETTVTVGYTEGGIARTVTIGVAVVSFPMDEVI
jgi:uncharacterized protein YjdB